MIELWNWPTPNGRKIFIALEELGLPYRYIPVNIGKGEQFNPEFLAVSPNNRIPGIVDPNGPGGGEIRLFESGAILIYLAEKTGRLMPICHTGRYIEIQWLMFQMGGVGPMFGQYNHFALFAPEKIPYAIDRYAKESNRLLGVLNKRLGESAYLGSGDYGIADIANFPWVKSMDGKAATLSDYPNVARWAAEIEARPAVQRAYEVK
jgi:GSH-dependent disulfide-bond oxidoreductase